MTKKPKKRWVVTSATYFRHDGQELSKRTYGPFNSRLLACIIGWMITWDNDYCTTSSYWLEEV